MKIRKLDLANRKIIPLFPSLLFQDSSVNEFNEVKDGLIEYAYKQREEDNTNKVVSNRGGWQTPTGKTKFFNDESFQPYLRWFSGRMKEYVDCLDYDLDKGRDVFLESMWFNFNGKGCYNVSHHHPSATLAGVLWLKAPKNCGQLVFESSNEFAEYDLMSVQKPYMVDNYLACAAYRINPEEGMMTVFPSHLRHGVEINNSEEDRISLAFNIQFRYIDG